MSKQERKLTNLNWINNNNVASPILYIATEEVEFPFYMTKICNKYEIIRDIDDSERYCLVCQFINSDKRVMFIEDSIKDAMNTAEKYRFAFWMDTIQRIGDYLMKNQVPKDKPTDTNNTKE